ncbi:MAG TPA: LysM peptidoglycan-binding domain-containing protein [Nocardioides sp.]|nr:LysM peptidoglycan-binding domain-containing protein [Nocardioides sp.]
MSTITLAPQLRPIQARRQPARGQVRLTRRGRLVVLVLALGVLAAVTVWLASGSAATRADVVAPQVEVVTVAPGDTLWDIASDAAAATGEDDVRDVMAHIEELNAIDDHMVFVGQQLRVPTS